MRVKPAQPSHKKCSAFGEMKSGTEFYRDNLTTDGLRHRCKTCMNASSKRWYEANKESHAESMGRWWNENREKGIEYQRRRIALHAERDKETVRAWKARNLGLLASYAAKRRYQQKIATPKWANAGDMAMWKEVAEVLSRSGIQFVVDHVVPIMSETVCGLHWEGNMQVLTKRENEAKQNLHWPEMP